MKSQHHYLWCRSSPNNANDIDLKLWMPNRTNFLQHHLEPHNPWDKSSVCREVPNLPYTNVIKCNLSLMWFAPHNQNTHDRVEYIWCGSKSKEYFLFYVFNLSSQDFGRLTFLFILLLQWLVFPWTETSTLMFAPPSPQQQKVNVRHNMCADESSARCWENIFIDTALSVLYRSISTFSVKK